MYSICRHYFYVVSFDFTIISIYSNDFIFVIVFFCSFVGSHNKSQSLIVDKNPRNGVNYLEANKLVFRSLSFYEILLTKHFDTDFMNTKQKVSKFEILRFANRANEYI